MSARRPLRLVFLGHSAELSGAELGLLELASVFEDVELTVLLAEDGPLVPRLEATPAAVEVLPLHDGARRLQRDNVRVGRLAALPAAASAAYALRVARRLRQLRPDLVHANTLKALMYGAVATRLARVPMVWHAHDRISEDYLPPTAVRLVRTVARRSAAGVIANSEATLSTLGPIVAPRLVVAEPVCPASFRERPRERNGRPFTFAMVGRLTPWKGQDVFLRAFAAAFPSGPERGVLVGAPLFGETEYERSLRSLVGRLGLQDRVELRGFREDVAAELASADVLVHASVIPEPFGRVIVEGMAAGLPVVAAGGGGPSEILTDGVDGLLYPPGDVGALAALLSRLARDPELAGRLGQAATERALAFSPESVARTTRRFYDQVLGDGSVAA